MKYLGWYILSAKSFKVSLHHMCVRFFQCFNSIYAKSHSFSEPVMQHLVNVHCKPYLLYGADVINWTRSELASISVVFTRFGQGRSGKPSHSGISNGTPLFANINKIIIKYLPLDV